MEQVTNFIQTYVVDHINMWIAGVLVVLFFIFAYIVLKK